MYLNFSEILNKIHLQDIPNNFPILWTFIVLFGPPFTICILLMISSLFLHIYKLRHLFRPSEICDFWKNARTIIAALWDYHGKILHGYEVVGASKLPKNGSALLIYYHGAFPVDIYYFLAHNLLYRKAIVYSIGDKFLFKLPGMRLFFDVFFVSSGSISSCVETINDGNMLTISPGGVREALFSTNKYDIIWEKRCGFAKIALQTNAPVIPMFTQNIREAYRSLEFGSGWYRRNIYERLGVRIPTWPVYGGFPVKLRTIIGDPVPYDSSFTPERLARATRDALQRLIQQHQRLPGSVMCALAERVWPSPVCLDAGVCETHTDEESNSKDECLIIPNGIIANTATLNLCNGVDSHNNIAEKKSS